MLSVIKAVAIILYLLLSTKGFAQQDESDNLKHSLTVDVASFLTKTISVSYNFKLNDKYELRINPRVSFDWEQDNMLFDFIHVADPFWYYNSYMLQVGLSRIWQTVYIEPMLYYKHASFDDRSMKLTDSVTDTYDVYGVLSREYDGGGIVFRSGLKVDKNHFRFNFYYGIGYYVRYYHEEISNESGLNRNNPNTYPRISDYWKDGLTLHIGFEIGYQFGKIKN